MSLLGREILAATALLVSSAQAATMEMMQAEVAPNVQWKDCADESRCDAPCTYRPFAARWGLVVPDWVLFAAHLSPVPLPPRIAPHGQRRQ